MDTAIYRLSAGDVRNGNIRFKQMKHLVTPDVLGGTSSAVPASKTWAVTFSPGATTRQFLYSDKWIFNNRNPYTKDFFASVGAVAGTELLVEKTGPHSIKISKR